MRAISLCVRARACPAGFGARDGAVAAAIAGDATSQVIAVAVSVATLRRVVCLSCNMFCFCMSNCFFQGVSRPACHAERARIYRDSGNHQPIQIALHG